MISGILLGLITALIANELSDFSPWLAARLVRLSARQTFHDDPQRAKDRAEELEADVRAVPGKLCQLGYGLGFAVAGLCQWASRCYKSRRRWSEAVLDVFVAVLDIPVLGWSLSWILTIVTASLLIDGMELCLEFLLWLYTVNVVLPWTAAALGLMAGFWIRGKVLRMRKSKTLVST